MKFKRTLIGCFTVITISLTFILQLNANGIKSFHGKPLQINKLGNKLSDGFVTPPDSAKPWVYMWWFDKITKTNITQHLEELKAKGVGGVMLFDVGGMPDAPYMSDKWRELFRHTASEADRLGLKIGTNICAGWPSGGSSIKPENASKMVVSSETIIKGPQHFSGNLNEPLGKSSPYEDMTVQAFPISNEILNQKPTITASNDSEDLKGVLDGNYMTSWHSGAEGKQWILVDFGELHLVDWTWIDMEGLVSIESSDDGIAFNPLVTLNGAQFNTIYGPVPSTKARWFRIVLPKNATVHDFALGTRIDVERFALLAAKRAVTNPLGVTAIPQADQVRFVRKDLVALPDDNPLHVSAMIDLTGKLSTDGTLNWDVPAGTWKVVRIGCTPTGIAAGDGLLPDYLSPTATDLNYEKAMKPLVGDAGTLVGRTYQYFHEDNVEIGGIYSWTPKLLEQFKLRRGYDPTPYLSAMAGEIVENAGITDRFLADVRRTIADCVADGHYGRWAELAHADGMKVRAEAGGQFHPRLLCVDGLMNQGRVDVPLAEFWESYHWKENQLDPHNHHDIDMFSRPGWDEAAQNVNAKQASSAAHLYGKRLVGSEAFTSLGNRAHWGVAPSDLLLYANIAFCEGINAISIHGSATSGPENGKPGKEFAAGTHFNHNVTWWNQGAEQFLSYLSRCQYMLQQGLFVADVLYYNGDEAPNVVPPKHIDPSRGFGYDYDVCNTEILLSRLSVKNGRIILPDGASYRVLVLPDRPVLPLSVAFKIKELVAAGATVIGPKPERTPGLAGYPKSDQQLREVANKVWGTTTASPILQHSYGKGKVVFGMSIKEVLSKTAVSPDFAFQSNNENALLDFIHRRSEDAEIYFVTNRRASLLQADCTFRVSGKQPELWDPVTGKQQDLQQFESKDGCTSISLEFEPYGSMFVIFRKEIPNSISGSQNSAQANFPKLKPIQELTGPWTVQFDPQWFYPANGLTADESKGMVVFEKLEDWSKRSEPAIKYFSGTAVYRQTFLFQPTSQKQRLFLDLGKVNGTVKVRFNNKDLGVVWCYPWRVEIADVIKPGENNLEIEVVNLWPNRLIGDANLPAKDRQTWHRYGTNPNQPLLPSGLLGPVEIFGN